MSRQRLGTINGLPSVFIAWAANSLLADAVLKPRWCIADALGHSAEVIDV